MAAGEREHALVVRERKPHKTVGSSTTQVVDQLGKKKCAKALTFQIGAHGYGELGLHVVRIGDCLGNAEHLLVASRIDRYRDERHLTVVIDLRLASDL